MKSIKDFYDERVAKVRWFENCGKEIREPYFEGNIIIVDSWTKAQKGINGKWDNLKLEIRNNLTGTLHERWRNEYREWNTITLEAKAVLQKGVLNELKSYVSANNINYSVYESVEWDLLCVLMEYAYSDLVAPGFYFKMFDVYEAGHLPCGWKGKWPEGNVLIF
ncbi:hypothetical protein [Paenibacillus sp. FSL L8-0463]|uniref:hypothetical protein n=1 Tax=Paenibacillus sp. FSL L8-0463 TaxID=2954687 RepID=UPI003119C45F